MIFLSMMVTTVQMKHNVPVPGATGGGLPPKLAGLLPILHDFSVTVVIMLIGIAPDVYNRYRQPIAFIFRFVRTMYIILLQKFPVQGTVGLALLTHRCASSPCNENVYVGWWRLGVWGVYPRS